MLAIQHRLWASLAGLVVILACGFGWYYFSKCQGFDACAAQAAEDQERVKPLEIQ